MDVDFLPEHLIIVGGSYIGLEFGQMFRRFGSEVTIVEMGAAPRSSARTRTSPTAIRDILEREGIAVRLDAKCISLTPTATGSRSASTARRRAGGRGLASAACRRAAPEHRRSWPRQAGRGDRQEGYIQVDDELRTNVPGIWALGDCNGRGAFTHTAYNDSEIVAANLLDNDPRRVSDRIPAYGLFIDPPLGRAGHDRSGGTRRPAGASLVGQRR